jgi:hypothetical protein
VLTAVTVAFAAYVLVEGRAGLYREDGRVVAIQDFASHTRFAGRVWAGGFADADSSLYTVEAHLQFMAEWAGEPVGHALPFGYSPTMVWVLGPFAAFPLPIAYVLWTLAGLGVTAWIVLGPRMNGAAALLTFLTPVAAAQVALGQTALLAAGGLFFLMLWSLREGEGRARVGVGWLGAIAVLWALSGKPPLAVTAGAALLAMRDVRTVVAALGLTAVTTLILLPWTGLTWPADYLHLLATYDRTQADSAFAWSLWAPQMTNLRALLFVDLDVPDAAASRVSNLLWAASLVLIVSAGWLRRITSGGAWALSIMAYLVLCSHVSFTEDLLLLLVPAAIVAGSGTVGVRWVSVAWFVIPFGLLLNSGVGPAGGVRPAPLFFMKIALAAWAVSVALSSVSRSAARATLVHGSRG